MAGECAKRWNFAHTRFLRYNANRYRLFDTLYPIRNEGKDSMTEKYSDII